MVEVSVEYSGGELVCYLDDDDTFHPDKVGKQVTKLLSSDDKRLGVITCDIQYNRSDLNKIVHNHYSGCLNELLFNQYIIRGSITLMITRDALHSIGGWDKSLPCNQEYDLLIRLSKYYNFDHVPEVLCYANESDNQISFNFKKKMQGTILLWRKHEYRFRQRGVKTFLYNVLRFAYLYNKYLIGRLFGRKVYSMLP